MKEKDKIPLLRAALERLRPAHVPPRSRRVATDAWNALTTSSSVFTAQDRGACLAALVLLEEENAHLRRIVRQTNRAITSLQQQRAVVRV